MTSLEHGMLQSGDEVRVNGYWQVVKSHTSRTVCFEDGTSADVAEITAVRLLSKVGAQND